jgi:hypothetical protein
MSAGSELPVFAVHVRVLPANGFPVELEAKGGELEQLARFCGVARFEFAAASLRVSRWRGGGVEVTGRIRARCQQPCVVTLVPVAQEIDVPVQATFVPAGSRMDARHGDGDHELLLDPEGPDAPEPFEGDEIDVWRLVAETLALVVDYWPRAPGATLDPRWSDVSRPDSPFAALIGWKPPSKSG